MPTAVLLAGPNGAGKTTFINQFLRERAEAFQFVNPDEVARDVPAGPHRDLAAGRLVLERLEEPERHSHPLLLFVILRQAA